MVVYGGEFLNIIVMKKILIMTIVLTLYSCMDVWFIADTAIPVNINCKDTLLLAMECGKIEITSSCIYRNRNSNIDIYVKQYFRECACVLNKDSLRFDTSDNIKIKDIQLFHRKKYESSRQTKRTEGNTCQINSEEIVFLCISTMVSDDWTYMLTILPCNSITCNGKPLITDTIKISLRDNRGKRVVEMKQ
jgi:hypothetical protein